MHGLTGVYLAWQVLAIYVLVSKGDEVRLCHDRQGSLPPERFRLRACTMCYAFLFQPPANPKPIAAMPPTFENLIPITANISADITGPIPADVTNKTTKNLICQTLSRDECSRWERCCEESISCCNEQLKAPLLVGDKAGQRHCGRTWDGFGCWGETKAGQMVEIECPTFIAHSIRTARAVKTCTENGTWFKKGHQEWTDYTPCLDKKGYVTTVYVSVACNIASICLLLPAIVIFFSFRELLRQHRVRLHINFFLSLLLAGLTHILWYMLVHYDMLMNPVSSDTTINNNPVWCRVLSFFKIYLTSTNYYWMFCEGYFLHRLISNAFEPPKTLIILYLIGWGVPVIPSVIYSALRVAILNDNCWARSIGGYQFIIYLPNLACLVVNLIFLCNILRILLFQLHAHPHEPSNFRQREEHKKLVRASRRRGLKAALMLVPLFGLQMFLTIYRPPPGAPGEKEYEYTTIVVTNSQGIFVSLIFCFCNGEVLNQMKNTCPCCRWMVRRRKSQCPTTSVTQITTYEDRRSPTTSRTGHVTDAPQKENSCLVNGKNDIELEEYTNSNGSLGKKKTSPSKKGDYIAIPSYTSEAAKV